MKLQLQNINYTLACLTIILLSKVNLFATYSNPEKDSKRSNFKSVSEFNPNISPHENSRKKIYTTILLNSSEDNNCIGHFPSYF